MTLREVYEYGRIQLEQMKIADAGIDAWYLLEFVTGINRTAYFLRMNDNMPQEQEQQYYAYIEKRKKHIPLQHITGEQEFMGLNFMVNEYVLIPRQDTEVLVLKVLEDLQPGMKILDMCTGSGCILISLMKMKGELCGIGVDISDQALAVAKDNAKRLEVNAVFLQSDLFEKVEGQYDVIVSNPPYIRTAVIEELAEEVKFHDPFLALDGKEDGLYFYRIIIEESIKYLKENGRLYFEIGHAQGEDVKKMMEKAGFSLVEIKKDLAGLDRVVFGVYS